MPVRVISASALESEVYLSNVDIHEKIDQVGNLIMDLHEEAPTLDILFVIPEEDENQRWQLCFGGSTVSMDFFLSEICIVDYDLEDGTETILRSFPADQTKVATQWLVNHLRG